MKAQGFRLASLALALCWMLTGCNSNQPVEINTPQVEASSPIITTRTTTPTTEPSPTGTNTESPTPTITTTPTPENNEDILPQPEVAISCEENWCIYPGHFWLSNPVEEGQIDHTYRYGGTQQYQRETHHGIELAAASGTPVVAAADGIVVVAGSDKNIVYGLYKGFYGNVVIIEHQSPYRNQTIYTLYAHLSYIDVKLGDFLLRGQYLGDVGSTGAALGSHLHFEVRVGTNNYLSTCNPELWLKPKENETTGVENGALAVRMVDGDTPIYTYPVTIEYYADPDGPVTNTVFTESYAWNTPNSGVWQENLAVNNLEPGQYRVSFIREDRWFREIVTILPGKLTIVNFNAK